MDFIWALVYPFRGRHWYLYLPLLAIGLIIPFFGIILGLAYEVAIIRGILRGEYSLPQRFVWQDGFHLLWCILLYSIPWLGILFIHDHLPRGIFAELALLVATVLLSIPFFIGAIRYALTDDTRTLIQIRYILNLIVQHKWQVAQFAINAILFLIVALALYVGLVDIIYNMGDLTGNTYYHAEDSPFLLIAFIVATPLWLALNICGMSYIIGQLARRMDLSEEKEKRKNDKIRPTEA
jgi:hypothetical protein